MKTVFVTTALACAFASVAQAAVQTPSAPQTADKNKMNHHHDTKQEVLTHHAHPHHHAISAKKKQPSTLGAIFGGQYASAYDGSDLFINGPSVNTDDVLLMIDQQNPQANSLVLSGAFEALATHDIQPDSKSHASLAAFEVQSYGTLDHHFHGFVDTYMDPNTLNVTFPRAFITIGDLHRSPFYATAGKFYVPFGSYSSSVINTLPEISEELGGIKSDAVTLGMNEAQHHINARVFAYRPNVHALGDHDVNGGADVEVTQHFQHIHMTEGASAVTNIADSDGVYAVFPAYTLKHRVAGLDVRGKLGLAHGVNAEVEYVTAAQDFATNDMTVAGKAVHPSVLHVEMNKGFDLIRKPAFAAVGMNQSYQAAALGIPQTRLYGMISFAPVRRTQIALELNDDIFYKSPYTIAGVASPAADGKSHLSLYLQAGIFF